MNWASFIQKCHKWLSIIIGIQILLWVSGGIVMSIVSIDEVRGDHHRKKSATLELKVDEFISISDLNSELLLSVSTINLTSYPRGSILHLVNVEGKESFVDAFTGKQLSRMDETHALTLARKQYVGDGRAVSATFLSESNGEYRSALPIWQIQFDDDENTRFYLHPITGRLRAVRTDWWRIYDFFWMFHIMDYKNREDFSHPLIIIASSVALLMTLSGLYLIVTSFNRKRKKKA